MGLALTGSRKIEDLDAVNFTLASIPTSKETSISITTDKVAISEPLMAA